MNSFVERKYDFLNKKKEIIDVKCVLFSVKIRIGFR